MANEATIKFKGDASDAIGEIKKLEGALDGVDSAAKSSGDSLGTVGEKADNSERSLIGLKDMVDGTATIMQGPGEAGIAAYIQGWADLAGGAANFAIPALQAVRDGLLANIKQGAAAALAHAKQIGAQVVKWVFLGAQSLLHAAKVAAAWLIAMGPIALVIAAVVGLVVVIVKNWDKIKKWIKIGWDFVKEKTRAVWDWIKRAVRTAVDFVVKIFQNWTLPGLIMKHWDKIKAGVSAVKEFISTRWNQLIDFFKGIPRRVGSAFLGMWASVMDKVRGVRDFIKGLWNGLVDWFRGLPGRVSSALGGLFDGIWSSFKGALNNIIRAWNNFRFSVTIPNPFGDDWHMSVNTPNIPYLHQGGVFRAPRPGGEGLAMLRDGERVLRPGQSMAAMAMGGGTTIQLVVDRRVLAEVVRDDLVRLQKRNGTTGLR